MNPTKLIAEKRPIIHIVNAVALTSAIVVFHINLLFVMIGGVIAGLFGGKMFCRWVCPMGWLMEAIMPKDKNAKATHLYQYYKMGCPIAWGSGLANKLSLFRIQRNTTSCVSCGKCDSACYIASLKPETSLYLKGKRDASRTYNCSKCLACVSACPKNSLSLGILSKPTTE